MKPRIWLEQFAQDIQFGLRSLRKSPGFTAVAVCSLALGIMATTAMYSVVHAVVLDPFPYKDVDALMSVKVWDPAARGSRMYYNPDEFLEIAERNTIFSGVISSTISDILWTGEGEPQRLRGNFVSTNTFNVLGVPPLAGRAILPSDGAADAAPVAVLGYRFWQRQFGGNRDVIGRQMRLNDRMRTVVGIMPPRFMWRGADVYLPVTFHRGQMVEDIRLVHVLGRLKPGVNDARAEADLRPIIADLKRQFPNDFPDKWRVGLVSFAETFPSGIRQSLWILFGAVALLLLIACSNVSNLLLSKGASRQKEMAVRAALGASRIRLVRQLLTESLVLSLAAAGLGAGLAFGALTAIIAIVPPGTIPDEAQISINGPVLQFTLAVSILTTLLFGLAPALYTCTADLANPLKEAGRGVTRGSRQAILRNGLVVAEVALSLMLLVGASLMIRTLIAMQGLDLGFRPDHMLTMSIPMSPQRYPDAARRIAFFEELLRRVKAIPGVRDAGVNTALHPLGNFGAAVEVAGSAQRDDRNVLIHETSDGYLAAYRIAVVQGRIFSKTDTAAKQHFAVVNRTFVERYLGGRPALGAVVRVPRMMRPPFRLADSAFQIIGVVNDVSNNIVRDELMPEIYVPYTLAGISDVLVVATEMPPMFLATAVQHQVYAIDKDQPVMRIKPLEAALDEYVFAGPRFNLVLFSVFGFLGLTLAAIGVYGVISHVVTQQTPEIGLRIALGASFRDVVGMILSRGLRLLAGGIVLGLIGSFAAARLLSKQLWNVSPFDPVSFAVVSAALLVVGLQACFWPARRAARVDPVRALRVE
jgi:putative ABC transport system permease protein